MSPRQTNEVHRAATPLELFFDLVFVVAIAQAAGGLHHAIAEHHFVDGIVGFALSFFGIWWAWMNFTWFASAYDCDDVPYRIFVFIQLTGALIFAAGVPDLAAGNLSIAVTGYVVMRLALVVQWLRAGGGDPERRQTAHRYALGIAVVQVGWIVLAVMHPANVLPFFVLLAAVEIAVPLWAESAGTTTWHAGHIAERYGLLTIIVLGESVLAATVAIQATLADGVPLADLLVLIGGGLLVLYSMWWLYFDRPVETLLEDSNHAFVWGYVHYFVFASAAAVGAALAVASDVATHHAEITSTAANWAIAIPVAVYVLCLWFLHDLPRKNDSIPNVAGPIVAVLVLCTPFVPSSILFVGIILALFVAYRLFCHARSTSASTPVVG